MGCFPARCYHEWSPVLPAPIDSVIVMSSFRTPPAVFQERYLSLVHHFPKGTGHGLVTGLP